MGKRRIEMRKIENKNERQVCFSNRRQGLFKKAKELSILYGIDIAVLVFSPAGRLFSFANMDVDSILNRYYELNQCPTSTSGKGGDNFWWEKVNVEEIAKEDGLQQLWNSLQEVKEKLASRIEDQSSASTLSLVPYSSDQTMCVAADLEWPSCLDCFLLSSMGDESTANEMHTTSYLEQPPPLPHDGVVQVEYSSLDFTKDDEGLMMIPTSRESNHNRLMKLLFQEEDDDELVMMSMISTPGAYTNFDDILFPPLNHL